MLCLMTEILTYEWGTIFRFDVKKNTMSIWYFAKFCFMASLYLDFMISTLGWGILSICQ